MTSSRHLILRGLLAAAAWVAFSAGAQASDWRGVDGKSVTLDPSSGVSLVVYTNGDLAKETRALTEAVNNLHPPKSFQMVRIIDLRGDVTPAVRPTVTKRIKSEVSKEAARLHPSYELNTIADFSGSTLRRVGWDNYSEKLQAVVYKNGKEVKRFSGASPSEIASYVKSQI